jgi:hypothetical protein
MQHDQQQQQQQWPLHVAVETADVTSLTLLIDSGVDVNCRNGECSTALQLACSADSSTAAHAKIVQLLLAAGANPNVTDDSSDTPLHVAVSFSRTEVVQQLLQHGAKLTAANFTGWTPLTLAARLGHTNIMRQLCDHADSQVQTANALEAAAATAAREGKWECLAQVLKAGGSIGGLEWVAKQVAGFGPAACSTACAAVVKAWVQETELLSQQWEGLRAGQREVVETKGGLQALLLSVLAANKQLQQQQQQQPPEVMQRSMDKQW